MGRIKSPVWSYVRTVPGNAGTDSTKEKVLCKFCKAEYRKNATQITDHLMLHCPFLSQNEAKRHAIKLQLQRFGSDIPVSKNRGGNTNATSATNTAESSSNAGHAGLSGGPNATAASIPTQSSGFQPSVDAMFDTMKHLQIEREELFARAIINSGCPFSLCENEDWKTFLGHICPSFKIPSRKKLSTELLDREFNRIEQKVSELLERAKTLTLQWDAFTNLNGEGVLNVVATTPQPVLVKTIYTGENHHTATYMVQEMSTVIEELGPEKVVGCVSDNASSMVRAKKDLKLKYPHMEMYGCLAHIYNLLYEDIFGTPVFSDLVADAKKVINATNASQTTLALFRQDQIAAKGVSHELKNPAKTRFASYHYIFDSLLACESSLKNLAIQSPPVIANRAIRENILREEFWEALHYAHDVGAPILENITKLEGDGSTVADVLPSWIEVTEKIEAALIVESPLHTVERSEIRKSLASRKNMSVTELHLMAHLLDPRACGSHLTPEQDTKAVSYLTEKQKRENPSVDPSIFLNEIAAFKMRSDFFGNPNMFDVNNQTNASDWWSAFCSTQNLCTIASKILKMPPTSCATERTFSSFGNILTKKRNRLTNEKTRKLLFIIFNTRLFREDKKAKKCGTFQYKSGVEHAPTPIPDPDPGESGDIEMMEPDELLDLIDDRLNEGFDYCAGSGVDQGE